MGKLAVAPFRLSEKQILEVEVLAAMGLPLAHISAYFRVSVATFHRAVKKSQAARDALENGRRRGDIKVIDTAFKMATDGKHPKMTMFWLKTRCGWRETTRLELTGPNGEPLAASGQLTAEQRQKRIQKLLSIKSELDAYNTKSGLELKQPEVLPTDESTEGEEPEKLPGE